MNESYICILELPVMTIGEKSAILGESHAEKYAILDSSLLVIARPNTRALPLGTRFFFLFFFFHLFSFSLTESV